MQILLIESENEQSGKEDPGMGKLIVTEQKG